MTADPGELTLHLERVMPATQAAVFTTLTEPEQIARWWGPKGFTAPRVDVDMRVGGTYRITMQPPEGDVFHVTGEFTEIDAPASLAYTFRYEEPDPDDRATVVTISLRDLGDATRLSVDQAHFATEARRSLHEQGWTESLDRLEEILRG
jgi:uncharacterized protein YndB with AHSA1/START domain